MGRAAAKNSQPTPPGQIVAAGPPPSAATSALVIVVEQAVRQVAHLLRRAAAGGQARTPVREPARTAPLPPAPAWVYTVAGGWTPSAALPRDEPVTPLLLSELRPVEGLRAGPAARSYEKWPALVDTGLLSWRGSRSFADPPPLHPFFFRLGLAAAALVLRRCRAAPSPERFVADCAARARVQAKARAEAPPTPVLGAVSAGALGGDELYALHPGAREASLAYGMPPLLFALQWGDNFDAAAAHPLVADLGLSCERGPRCGAGTVCHMVRARIAVLAAAAAAAEPGSPVGTALLMTLDAHFAPLAYLMLHGCSAELPLAVEPDLRHAMGPGSMPRLRSIFFASLLPPHEFHAARAGSPVWWSALAQAFNKIRTDSSAGRRMPEMLHNVHSPTVDYVSRRLFLAFFLGAMPGAKPLLNWRARLALYWTMALPRVFSAAGLPGFEWASQQQHGALSDFTASVVYGLDRPLLYAFRQAKIALISLYPGVADSHDAATTRHLAAVAVDCERIRDCFGDPARAWDTRGVTDTQASQVPSFVLNCLNAMVDCAVLAHGLQLDLSETLTKPPLPVDTWAGALASAAAACPLHMAATARLWAAVTVAAAPLLRRPPPVLLGCVRGVDPDELARLATVLVAVREARAQPLLEQARGLEAGLLGHFYAAIVALHTDFVVPPDAVVPSRLRGFGKTTPPAARPPPRVASPQAPVPSAAAVEPLLDAPAVLFACRVLEASGITNAADVVATSAQGYTATMLDSFWTNAHPHADSRLVLLSRLRAYTAAQRSVVATRTAAALGRVRSPLVLPLLLDADARARRHRTAAPRAVRQAIVDEGPGVRFTRGMSIFHCTKCNSPIKANISSAQAQSTQPMCLACLREPRVWCAHAGCAAPVPTLADGTLPLPTLTLLALPPLPLLCRVWLCGHEKHRDHLTQLLRFAPLPPAYPDVAPLLDNETVAHQQLIGI